MVYAKETFKAHLKHFIESSVISTLPSPDSFMKTILFFLSSQGINIQDLLWTMIIYSLEIRNLDKVETNFTLNYSNERRNLDEDESNFIPKSKFMIECLTILQEKLASVYKNEKENETVIRITFFNVFILDLYRNSKFLNQKSTNFFEEIYSKTKDPRNQQLISFFESCRKALEKSSNKELNQRFLTKTLNLLCDDLIQRTKQMEFLIKEDCFLRLSTKNFFDFLKIFENEQLYLKAFNMKMMNDLMGILCYCVSQNSLIKRIFIEEEILNYFMNIGKEWSEILLNELEYLESFFKLLEALCFDKEYYHLKQILSSSS